MAAQQFACEICLENYDSRKRVPKFLDCFHTFCLSCLQVSDISLCFLLLKLFFVCLISNLINYLVNYCDDILVG